MLIEEMFWLTGPDMGPMTCSWLTRYIDELIQDVYEGLEGWAPATWLPFALPDSSSYSESDSPDAREEFNPDAYSDYYSSDSDGSEPSCLGDSLPVARLSSSTTESNVTTPASPTTAPNSSAAPSYTFTLCRPEPAYSEAATDPAVMAQWRLLVELVGADLIPSGPRVGGFFRHLLSAEQYDAMQLILTARLMVNVMALSLGLHIKTVYFQRNQPPTPLNHDVLRVRDVMRNAHKLLTTVTATQRHVDGASEITCNWPRASKRFPASTCQLLVHNPRLPVRPGRFHYPSPLLTELSDHDNIYLFSLLYNTSERIREKPLNTFHTKASPLTVPFLIRLICNSSADVEDAQELILGYLTVSEIAQLSRVAHEASLWPVACRGTNETRPFLQRRHTVLSQNNAPDLHAAEMCRLRRQNALNIQQNILVSNQLRASSESTVALS